MQGRGYCWKGFSVCDKADLYLVGRGEREGGNYPELSEKTCQEVEIERDLQL